jgi:hypothetical protein
MVMLIESAPDVGTPFSLEYPIRSCETMSTDEHDGPRTS